MKPYWFHFLLLSWSIVSLMVANVTCSGGDKSDTFTAILENIMSEVEKAVRTVSSMVLDVALRILSILYAPMAVVGIILYTTRIDKYLGKELIVGALLLAFFAEFVLPALLSS